MILTFRPIKVWPEGWRDQHRQRENSRFEASYSKTLNLLDRENASWQHNLRAIALGLEALRTVERYGIAERGQQYAGYRELGAGMAMGPATMTVEQAAAFLVEHGEFGGTPADPDELIGAPDAVAAYFREAAKRLHPDVGGDAELFKRLTEARDLLLGASDG